MVSACAHCSLPLRPHCVHRGPPAGWLQPTLAIPLQDLRSVELGLAAQSLRLEWVAGVGSCVLLPRDAKRCRAFLEELTGERGKGEERGGPGAEPRCPVPGACGGDSWVTGLIPLHSWAVGGWEGVERWGWKK